MVDERVVGSEERPADEEYQKHRLRDDERAPLAGDEVAEFVEVAVGDIRGRRRHDQHERDGERLYGRDVRQSQHPEQVRDEENAEGFAEGKAPVSKSWEKVEGKRQCRQPDNLYGNKPSKGVEHDGGIILWVGVGE